MPDGLPEKLKQAILDIFEENNNHPLSLNELIPLLDKKVGNGEINYELTGIVIQEMENNIKITRHPDNKVSMP